MAHLLAIVGSRRRNGNTRTLADAVLAPAAAAGHTIETRFLADFRIEACTGCEGCAGSWECVIDDDFAALVARIDVADAVVLASPTYWYSVTSDMKRFIDRSYSLIDYPVDRHHWVGKYTNSGTRAVTVAVCEQNQPEMMGNTLTLLSAFARDIGLELVDEVAAYGFFAPGTVASAPVPLERAAEAGRALIR